MCGRIFVRPSKAQQLFLESLGIDMELPTLNNLAPTEAIPVITRQNGAYQLGMMRWWLHPAWSPDPPNQKYAMFNARIETIQTSRAFKGPIAYRRGIVPADGFVEWKTTGATKQPYYCQPEDQALPLALAAIWEVWQEQVWSCAIVTQPANDAFRVVHDRMPLSLTQEEAISWMDTDRDAKSLIADFTGRSLRLRAMAVQPSVNNARNKGDLVFSE